MQKYVPPSGIWNQKISIELNLLECQNGLFVHQNCYKALVFFRLLKNASQVFNKTYYLHFYI